MGGGAQVFSPQLELPTQQVWRVHCGKYILQPGDVVHGHRGSYRHWCLRTRFNAVIQVRVPGGCADDVVACGDGAGDVVGVSPHHHRHFLGGTGL